MVANQEPRTAKYGKTALDLARQGVASGDTKATIIELLEEARFNSARPSQAVPVLPRNWSVVTDTETKKSVYQSKTGAKETLSTPPAYPLYQTRDIPDVTFFDEPQEKQFTSSCGYTDFENGVEVTVPPSSVAPKSTVVIKVQPAFAPSDTFLLPEGIQSASPSYFISSESPGLIGEVTLTMEHHVRISTIEEADGMVFLEADTLPETSSLKSVYQFQEVPRVRSDFTVDESTGTLITRGLSQFFKIGIRTLKEDQVSDRGDNSPPKCPASCQNLYTVRACRSPPDTTCDRIAIITVSLYGRLYEKLHKILDKKLIPRDYPSVSKEVADQTVLDSISFVEISAKLNIHPIQGWSVEVDKDVIARSEVDQPEMDNFRPEDLHDYPPRIICRIFPEESVPKRTTCYISLSGLTPETRFNVPI